MQNTVAISTGFLDAFAKLPRKVQQKVTSFILRFRANPMAPGLNYEKVQSADGKMFSLRIDDTYRAIVARQKESGVHLLLWVDHHDEAYDWARKRRVSVNAQTGAIQVYEAVECKSDVPVPQKPEVPLLFALVSDETLSKLGVPTDMLPVVRAAVNISDLESLRSSLPDDAYEGLEWLANGFPEEEVLELVSSGEGGDAPGGDFATALENPQTARSFVVIEGEDELRQILAEPLEKWRVFLHPSQRRIVERTFNGPARVLGGAGTGKTVVAMHRARKLADSLTDPGERVLLTTFSSTLASDIRVNLKRFCTIEQLRRIEVTTLDSWAARFLKRQGFSYEICYDDDRLGKVWERAIESVDGADFLSVRFFEDEWVRVVLSNQVSSLAEYAHVKRAGRGRRLTRKERLLIWPVFEEYMRLLRVEGIRDAPRAMQEAYLTLRQMPGEYRYSHVVVDEAQDFSTPALRLIRELAGEQHADDIFIAGDAHQRIYGLSAPLSKCGIDIRGRGNILRINYRTTEEIRKSAMGVLEGVSFDDLDEGMDDGRAIQSLTHGEAPVLRTFKDAGIECDFISSEIKSLSLSPEKLRTVCVALRRRADVEEYEKLLKDRGLVTFQLKRNRDDDPGEPGVRLATMHRVKGLEFDWMFVANVSKDTVPPKYIVKGAREEGELDWLYKSERSLLYVAMTRAKQGVYVTCAGATSALVHGVFD